MKKQFIWFLPACMVALGILSLSTFLSVPIQIEGVGYVDKIEHLLAYLVLTISFLYAFRKAGTLTDNRAVQVVVICTIYGLLLELAQYILFTNRFFEWVDASANALGSGLGFFFYKMVYASGKKS